MTLKVKALITVAVIAAVFGAGWTTKGWFEDSKDLAAVEAQQALAALIRQDLGQISTTVEDHLQGLKANERIIDRGIIREIQQPVYRNVCVPPDSDAFRLLNSIANGAAPQELDD